MQNCSLIGLAALICTTLSAVNTALAKDIALYFTGRPPFIWQDEQGLMHGISFEIGEKVFRSAKIPYHWEQAPSARVQHYFSTDNHPLCLVNWIYTEERDQLGKISLPTYVERDYLAVFPNANFDRFYHKDIDGILADDTLIVLIKAGYAYSSALEKKFASMAAQKIDMRGDQQRNFQLLAEQRADIGFFEQQELERFVVQFPALADKVTIIRYPSVNLKPTTRHVICSKSVSDADMARINAAISQLHVLKSSQ
ncbi:transporter substrate-binding domain-containing protein [Shewanella avicenniae]|uniref:Transporter substrate-binding domain-containing protein n=1 Tax=Shewanella avicenniae TaxID=2814294 RepID=A0ABX7QLE0_9GAMM|nr:transporter substrate-binding domain-containing protein [Shewanella avicenniae]QSX32267.1 transporter substrate-binding domain-containing protein [Shewanella avicenniae]